MHKLSWERVRHEVCTACVDGDGRGRCRLPVDESCAVRSQLQLIGRLLEASGGAAEAEAAVRRRVCRECGAEDGTGGCWRRNRLECAFDRDLTRILRIVERSLGQPAEPAS